MHARACQFAVAALSLALGACAGVAPRAQQPATADAAAAPLPAAVQGHLDASLLAHLGFTVDLPPPIVDEDWFAAVFAPADDAMTGRVSWYGKRFAGRRTANGERFDPKDFTMAHRRLPFGTRVRVTNPSNGHTVVVRVNDRGPFVGERIADLSHAAARRLGMVADGVIVARLEVLDGDAAPALGAPVPSAASR